MTKSVAEQHWNVDPTSLVHTERIRDASGGNMKVYSKFCGAKSTKFSRWSHGGGARRKVVSAAGKEGQDRHFHLTWAQIISSLLSMSDWVSDLSQGRHPRGAARWLPV
eukprot:COSAG01_NODE_2548_length_7465_cov_15.046294_6_plen_108_part_00